MNSYNILTFFLVYLLISFSILGYGLLVERFHKKKNFGEELGFTGLLGIFVLIIYSYISHFFIAHNIFHNSIFFVDWFNFFLFFI